MQMKKTLVSLQTGFCSIYANKQQNQRLLMTAANHRCYSYNLLCCWITLQTHRCVCVCGSPTTAYNHTLL